MANSELSKLKILFIYDYFINQVSAYDEDSTVSVSDIIGYLESVMGYTFERKSIYADIAKINEYMIKNGKVKGDWIYSEGKRYRRKQISDEITIDEARLIVDAISTTTFVETALCDKIIDMFPKYFPDGYQMRALYPHDEKINRRTINWLNNIRNAIDKREALKISYGYKLGNDLTEKADKVISPMALDWANNCYYVIAIDNAEAKELKGDESLSSALKRYRVDRMAQVSPYSSAPYIDYENERLRVEELKRFIHNSLSAFSSGRPVQIGIVIKGQTRKDVLKAYAAFTTKLSDKVKIADDTKLDKGVLSIDVVTGLAPTLYTDLFELSTFENVEIEIDNEEVCRKYGEYIKKAAQAAKLKKL